MNSAADSKSKNSNSTSVIARISIARLSNSIIELCQKTNANSARMQAASHITEAIDRLKVEKRNLAFEMLSNIKKRQS